LPNIHTPAFANVENYSHVFGLQAGRYHAVGYDELPKLQALLELARSRPRMREHLLLDHTSSASSGDFGERFFVIGVAALAHETLDRLLHTVGPRYTEDDIRSVYCELERGLLAERLEVELYVPLALTHVEVEDSISFDDRVRVERMTDDLELARVPESAYGITVHPCVLEAARHAVVLSGLSFENPSRFILYTNNLSFYPREQIDRVFDALRAATGVPTGYAQIFMRPVGWAWDYRAHLPTVITGALTRRYPAAFDDGWWLRDDLSTVSLNDLKEAGRIYRALQRAPRRLTLAAERLSAAMLREDEADSILDLCIGLEAVLGDESPGDTTYKLALRTAAVLAQHESSPPPPAVFGDVKGIYRHRSAVAHGRDPQRTRTLRSRDDETERSTVDVARNYLRTAIRVLADRPELAAKPEKLDEGLILGTLARDDSARLTSSS
jgi:hypothetical protein